MLDINIKIRLLLYNCQDRLRQWVLIMAVLNLRILLSGSFIQINFRKIGFRDGTSMELALTLRRLMSYIYGAPILDVSRSHTTTQHRR